MWYAISLSVQPSAIKSTIANCLSVSSGAGRDDRITGARHPDKLFSAHTDRMVLLISRCATVPSVKWPEAHRVGSRRRVNRKCLTCLYGE